MKKISRREWLKQGLMTSAIAALPGIPHYLQFDPTSELAAFRKPDLIKLNANENPYGPSSKAKQALIDSIDGACRYPMDAIRDLVKSLSIKEDIPEQCIIIGAGSTELLGIAGLIFGLTKKKIVSPFPTFDFLMSFSEYFGAKWVKVPLTTSFETDLTELQKAVDEGAKMVFICNPNNPTGTEIDPDILKTFVSEVSETVPVYLDEAYIEFSKNGLGSSMVDLVRKGNRNVIIGRTFSKIYGMAGLRVGYAYAHPDVIQKMRKYAVGRTVSPSVCSVAAAVASAKDDEFVDYCRGMNNNGKELVYNNFNEWEVNYTPSSTSFIWFSDSRFQKDLRGRLQKRDVLIRNYGFAPGYCRVSIGTLTEMEAFLDESKKLLI